MIRRSGKKRNSLFKGRVFTLPLVIIMLLSFPLRTYSMEMNLTEDEEDIGTAGIANWPKAPEISAECAVLMEESTGAVLYSKNPHRKAYPAAITAIMTSMLAVEMCDLDNEVVFSHDAVFDVPPGVVNIGIDAGEVLSVAECLQAILVRGACECGFALSEYAGGSREAFVAQMNTRAAECGCLDTSFSNPVGIHSDDHYSTAYDLALIGRDFFDNELLCKYSLQKSIHFYPTENQKDEIIVRNPLKMTEGSSYSYEGLIGAKGGYTDEAGYCLIAGAQRGDMKLIAVILNDGDDERYEDVISLFDYGFSDFKIINASEYEKSYDIGANVGSYAATDIMGDSRPMLSLDKTDRIVLPLTLDFDELESSITYENNSENEAARIVYDYEGQYLGKCSILFGEQGALYDFGAREEEKKPEEPVNPGKTFVFINIRMVALISAGIVAAIFSGYGIIRSIRKYRKAHPNWRKQYRRQRRRPVFPELVNRDKRKKRKK